MGDKRSEGGEIYRKLRIGLLSSYKQTDMKNNIKCFQISNLAIMKNQTISMIK